MPTKKQMAELFSTIESIDPILKFVGAISAACFLLFNTFATVSMLKEGVAEAKLHSDDNTKRIEQMVEVTIRQLKTIDDRTWEMNGRRGTAPVEPEINPKK